MYESLHATRVVAQFEQEELARAVELRRFQRAHADRIVPARPGGLRRMLRTLVRIGRSGAVAAAPATAPAAASAAPATDTAPAAAAARAAWSDAPRRVPAPPAHAPADAEREPVATR